MNKSQAKQLHDGDRIEVKVNPGNWISGKVIGSPAIDTHVVHVDVETHSYGKLKRIHHRHIRVI